MKWTKNATKTQEDTKVEITIYQTEIIRQKNLVGEMKSSLEALTSRVWATE